MVENQFNNPPPEFTDLEFIYRARISPQADAPVIYAIHGRAGNDKVMWTFARTFPAAVNAVLPQAKIPDPILPHSPNGLSWWTIGGTKADLLENAKDAAGALKSFFEKVEAKHSLAPRKRIVIGFSQGAAVSSALVQNFPGFFTAAGLLSGFAIEYPDIKMQQGFPVFLAHGTKDEIITISRFERSQKYLENLGCAITSTVEDIGHKVGVSGMRQLATWISAQL